MIRLVTISREFGAGGSELATALGSRLEWPVLDHDIVHRVAERLRVDDQTVERLDEHSPSLLARIATVLIVPQPEMFSFSPTPDLVSHDAIADAARAEIEAMAASPPAIIVGHGAQSILAAREDAMHVRVVAPVPARIERVMRRLRVDRGFATTLMRQADHDRQAYVQRYFHRDWHSPLLYDLQINTGRVTIDEAAAAIADLVHRRAPAATGAEASPAR
jgi:cytidylate kinase